MHLSHRCHSVLDARCSHCLIVAYGLAHELAAVKVFDFRSVDYVDVQSVRLAGDCVCADVESAYCVVAKIF